MHSMQAPCWSPSTVEKEGLGVNSKLWGRAAHRTSREERHREIELHTSFHANTARSATHSYTHTCTHTHAHKTQEFAEERRAGAAESRIRLRGGGGGYTRSRPVSQSPAYLAASRENPAHVHNTSTECSITQVHAAARLQFSLNQRWLARRILLLRRLRQPQLRHRRPHPRPMSCCATLQLHRKLRSAITMLPRLLSAHKPARWSEGQ